MTEEEFQYKRFNATFQRLFAANERAGNEAAASTAVAFHEGLLNLLIAKGLFTRAEYYRAAADHADSAAALVEAMNERR